MCVDSGSLLRSLQLGMPLPSLGLTLLRLPRIPLPVFSRTQLIKTTDCLLIYHSWDHLILMAENNTTFLGLPGGTAEPQGVSQAKLVPLEMVFSSDIYWGFCRCNCLPFWPCLPFWHNKHLLVPVCILHQSWEFVWADHSLMLRVVCISYRSNKWAEAPSG